MAFIANRAIYTLCFWFLNTIGTSFYEITHGQGLFYERKLLERDLGREIRDLGDLGVKYHVLIHILRIRVSIKPNPNPSNPPLSHLVLVRSTVAIVAAPAAGEVPFLLFLLLSLYLPLFLALWVGVTRALLYPAATDLDCRRHHHGIPGGHPDPSPVPSCLGELP